MYTQDGQNSNGERGVGKATVKVIGVGGGGCNAVARMFQEPIEGVDYLAVNTDAQHLMKIQVPSRCALAIS